MIRAHVDGGRGRRGITLTECLIGIMILAVGLISIATLFPIGLMRLHEAQKMSRSSLLFESAASDMAARNLVQSESFLHADLLNRVWSLPHWYPSSVVAGKSPAGLFNPLLHDAPSYGADPFDATNPGLDTTNPAFNVKGSAGLPFAYDPLWRYQTVAPGNPPDVPGIYLRDAPGGTLAPEARFGSGVGFIRDDSDGFGAASAHGLQRLTNFNGRVIKSVVVSGRRLNYYIMQSSSMIPGIFVSPEDVVWNEKSNPFNLSTILPDRSLSGDGSMVNDWRYSWMATGRLSSSSNGSTFDCDLVIYENRPFALEQIPAPINSSVQVHRPADEMVVEAVFGFSRSVVTSPLRFGGRDVGYGAAADRTVLLRWPNAAPDPIVKAGTWICDVTYERAQRKVFDPSAGTGRFLTRLPSGDVVGIPNPLNGGKWDNLPAQRAFWYQVVKASPAVADPQLANHRSMVVQVGSRLRSRTPLMASGAIGMPATINAALIAPHVVNVIPQTIVIH